MILLRQGLNKLRLQYSWGHELKQLFSSKHKVFQIKNNSMMIIEDNQQQLPYMSEIELEDGRKGVVLKIQETGTTYVGMYESVNTLAQQSVPLAKQAGSVARQIGWVNIKKINKNWKHSTGDLLKTIVDSPSQGVSIYDVNGNLAETIQSTNQQSHTQQQVYELLNGKKRRLKSSSPILNICNDLYYGDMISFMGCRGSKKSQNSWRIAKQFTNSQNSVPIYVNPFLKEVKQFAQYCPKAVAFTVPHSQMPTDAGVYMLTLKAINLSIELKKKGKDVLLIVDRLSDIMMREWNLLQSIKFNAKSVDSSKLFQYNTLKISPISIMNEVYSSCEDNKSLPTLGSRSSNNNKGSLTSILITQKQNNELVQEISSFSNNLKHLQTLSKVIEFPLNFKINTNLYYQKPQSQQQFNQIQAQPDFHQKELHRFLRTYLNKYLNDRNQTELKRQLYKNDVRDSPWDYYSLLDAEWWTTGIKEIAPLLKSFKQANQFLIWISFNIEKDYLGHWAISAKQSYLKLLTFIKNKHNLPDSTSSQEIQLSEQQMEQFVQDGKMQGLMNPFKKDYLV